MKERRGSVKRFSVALVSNANGKRRVQGNDLLPCRAFLVVTPHLFLEFAKIGIFFCVIRLFYTKKQQNIQKVCCNYLIGCAIIAFKADNNEFIKKEDTKW